MSVQPQPVSDERKQKRSIRKLFVGKNGTLRDTAALAPGRLTSDDPGAFTLTYTFASDIRINGRLTLRFWTAPSFNANPEVHVQLLRTTAGSALHLRDPTVLGVRVRNHLHSEDNVESSPVDDTFYTGNNKRLLQLQLETHALVLRAGESLTLTLQLRQEAAGPPAVMYFGGDTPSQLWLEEDGWQPPYRTEALAAKRSDERLRAAGRSEQILDAAEHAFNVKGLAGASVAEISAAAELSQGHLYNFFSGKESIIFACIKRKLDRDSSLLTGYATRPRDPARHDLGAFIEFVLRENILGLNSNFALEISIESTRNARVHEMVRDCETQLKEILGEKIRRTRIAAGKQSETVFLDASTRVIYAFIQGLRFSNRSGEHTDPQDTVRIFSAALKSLVADVLI